MNYSELKRKLTALSAEDKELSINSIVDVLSEGLDKEFLREFFHCESNSQIDCAYLHAQKGSTAAQIMYATFVFFTDQVKRPKHEALFWLKRAEASNNPQASFLLGLLYQQGKVVEESPKKVFKYFKRAAQRGHDKARYMLAQCYLESYGTDYNEANGLVLLNQLASEGFEKAVDLLDEIST